MSWKEYLVERARKTANRRRRIYGIEPAPTVRDLLIEESPSLNLRKKWLLLSYILFKSPQRRLELFWKYITDRDTPVRRRQIESLAKDLRSHLSEDCRVAANYFERRNYSRDLARVPALMEKMLHRTTPTLVVQPKTEKDISSILAYCNLKNLAVFPRGSGSSAFGGAIPTRNGIVIDLSPMMAVREIDPEAQTVRVQPGARWADVATHLEPHGLIPQTSPTSRFSTVAGWISTGGMGLDSYKYGSVHESVLAVRVVRPDGTIEELHSEDKSIKDLFGTEGQFGILTEVTLRVRLKPEYSGARMFTFNDPGQAFEFIDNLTNNGLQATHVVYFDREFLKRENILFVESSPSKDPIVPEHDAVLLHFESQDEERKFLSYLSGNSKSASSSEVPARLENGEATRSGNGDAARTKNAMTALIENDVAARYLWADRFFPLKAQRIGPSLLGSEVVIPRRNILKYIKTLERLARHFNINPTVEVIVCGDAPSPPNNKEITSNKERLFSYLIIVSFTCDHSKTVHYILSLLFIQLLVRIAVRSGGAPYGIGIWNTPFIRSKYNQGDLKKLRQRKTEIDPNGILNPNKFFKIKGRFFNVPSFFLNPVILRPILALSSFLAPVLGPIARLSRPEPQSKWNVPPQKVNQGKDLLLQSSQRCTSCGACISVCPAYSITEDELVTGRSKLRMAEAMTNGLQLEESEAFASFQCLHCGLCEEVCQTHLPLRDCYLVLEDWLEDRFGPPAETVQEFIDKLDSRREFIKDIFGLDLPDWSPEESLTRVPIVERSPNRGSE